MKVIYIWSLCIFTTLFINAFKSFSQQAKGKVAVKKYSPSLSAIREDQIKNDLFAMTNDRFRGREAGTLDELKVSVWLANQASIAGLKPAGDDGTFSNFFLFGEIGFL